MILCTEEDCFLFVYSVNSFSLDKGQRVLPVSMSNSGLVNDPYTLLYPSLSAALCVLPAEYLHSWWPTEL